MLTRLPICVQIMMSAIFCLSLCSMSNPCMAADADIAKLKEAHGDFSITTLPPITPDVNVNTAERLEFAKAIALSMEKAGIKTPEVSDIELDSKSIKRDDLASLVEALKVYLKKNPIKTDYVYATVFYGTPKTGATSLLTVVADRDGKIVWEKRQDAGDKDFQKLPPTCPLKTCYVSFEPFRQALGLRDPDKKSVNKGKWERYFEEKQKQRGQQGGGPHWLLFFSGIAVGCVMTALLLFLLKKRKSVSNAP